MSLRRAVKAVTGYYDSTMASAGITVNQYALLTSIFKIGPCSISALAKAMRLERTTLVRNIKPLFETGLIQDESNGNARNRQLVITDAGYARLKTARPLWKKAQQNLKKYLGETDFTVLMDAASRLEKIT
jgi:DNA-binding MarR family transcriptional regulator